MGNIFSELLNSPTVTEMYNGLTAFAREAVFRHTANVYRLTDNLEALQKAVDDLRALRNQLMERVIAAERDQTRMMRRSEQAESWFRRVEGTITKGDELVRERENQVQRLVLGGVLSTNYISSSVFGGKVVKCIKNLDDLREDGVKLEGEGLTRDAAIADQSIQGAVKHCDPTVGLEAKLDEVLTCLREEQEVGIVGLYGIGGVGKTTLLKKISNHFVRPSSDFNHVVWIDMSTPERVDMIQKDIVEKFGLLNDWRYESIEQKAEYISNELEQKKFLLLLDDIKKPIDLSKIGVPHPRALNGSKVVFTTREADVMTPRPQRTIAVEILTEEKALELFRMHVGEDTLNSGPRIPELAKRVASKCGRLPLALKIIGEAMSGKREVLQWEHAIQTFERPSKENEHGIDEVCSILRYSYDNLPSETLKSCFLYCALYSEGSRIRKSLLVETWTFEEFWIDSDEPEFKGYSIVSALCGACLCEDDGQHIRLHDVVRSMALRVAEEDTLVRAGMSLIEAPGRGEWKRMKRVSLMKNNIQELTEVPECPHLLTLTLLRNKELHSICDGFFRSMGKLGVLNLSATDVKQLPKSISRLVSLKYLDISSTKITELPIDLRKLIRLKLLNVNGLSLVFKTSRQVIRYLTDLQILKINCEYRYDGKRVPKTGKVKENDEMLLEELQCLDQLNALEIRIESSPGLNMFLETRKLLKITKVLCLFGCKAQPDVPKLSETPKLLKITRFLRLFGFKAQLGVPPAPEPMAGMEAQQDVLTAPAPAPEEPIAGMEAQQDVLPAPIPEEPMAGMEAQQDVLPAPAPEEPMAGMEAQQDVLPAPAPEEPMACMDLSAVATMERLKSLEIRSCEYKRLKFDSPGRQSTSSANGTC